MNIIGVKTNCFKGFSAKETFEGIKEANFKYIEVSATPNSNTGISRFSSFSEICALKEKLKELDLIPIGLGGHTDIIDNPIDFRNNIHLAHFLECKYMVTSVGNPHSEQKENIDEIKVVNTIKEYLPLLEKFDMRLVIELHGSHCTAGKLSAIIKGVNSERVKINYDTANALYYGNLEINELLEDIEKHVDMIGYMHIKDKLGGKQEWNFPALGKGYIPFDEIFKILRRNNNECPLIVEIEFTPNGVNSIDEVKKALIDSLGYLEKRERH